MEEINIFLNSLDFASVIFGALCCMFMDILFSICNFFLQRAYEARSLRKRLEELGEDYD